MCLHIVYTPNENLLQYFGLNPDWYESCWSSSNLEYCCISIVRFHIVFLIDYLTYFNLSTWLYQAWYLTLSHRQNLTGKVRLEKIVPASSRIFVAKSRLLKIWSCIEKSKSLEKWSSFWSKNFKDSIFSSISDTSIILIK